MEKNASEKKGLSRRGFIKAAGVIGAVALAKNAGAQMPILVAENPLIGAFDMHSHTFPDQHSRCINDLDLARKAKETGMRGVVIKNHEFSTNSRAYLTRQIVPGIEVFGSVTLNDSMGGINPVAVDRFIKFNLTGGFGKIIWLPTHDAAHHKGYFSKNPDAPGLRVIDSTGKVIPELRKVLNLIARADLIFATGHVSPKEGVAAVKAAKEEGVKKVVVTHPMQTPVEMPMDDMKRCVEMGAMIEHTFLSFLMGPQARLEWMKVWRHVSLEDYAKAIKELGAENCVLVTDLGQYRNPIPADGMKEFILGLKAKGIKQEEIDLMVKKNPARLLGLPV